MSEMSRDEKIRFMDSLGPRLTGTPTECFGLLLDIGFPWSRVKYADMSGSPARRADRIVKMIGTFSPERREIFFRKILAIPVPEVIKKHFV